MMQVLPAVQPAPAPSGAQSSGTQSSAGARSNEDDASFLAVLGEALSAMSGEVDEEQGADGEPGAIDGDSDATDDVSAPVLPADALAALVAQLDAAVESTTSGAIGEEAAVALETATQTSDGAANEAAVGGAAGAPSAEATSIAASVEAASSEEATTAAATATLDATPTMDPRSVAPTEGADGRTGEGEASNGQPAADVATVAMDATQSADEAPDGAEPMIRPAATTTAASTTTAAAAEPVASTAPATPTAPVAAAPNMFDVDPATLEDDDPWQQLATVVRPLRNMADGSQRLSLQLRPAELGTVHLEVSVDDGQLSVRAVTETTATRDLLAGALPELRAELSKSGIDVGSLDVGENTTDGSGADGQASTPTPNHGLRASDDAATPSPRADPSPLATQSGRLDLSL